MVISLLIASLAGAKLNVEYDIKEVARHKSLITLSWNITVDSDKNWDACDLIISFRDSNGKEIYAIAEQLKLKIGPNSFTGHEICDISVWMCTKQFTAELDCVF